MRTSGFFRDARDEEETHTHAATEISKVTKIDPNEPNVREMQATLCACMNAYGFVFFFFKDRTNNI